ncbi:MAG: ISAs1 family transposase [Gemmataceae bacterium]
MGTGLINERLFPTTGASRAYASKSTGIIARRLIESRGGAYDSRRKAQGSFTEGPDVRPFLVHPSLLLGAQRSSGARPHRPPAARSGRHRLVRRHRRGRQLATGRRVRPTATRMAPDLLEVTQRHPVARHLRAALPAAGPGAFQRCLLGWLRGLADRLGAKQFAIDGKALRGSAWDEKGLAMLHSVSIWATDVNLTLGHVAVESHSNEIPAIPKLLALLSLEGALVTIDAMGCQKEVARAVTAAKADYLLVVKGNQQRLMQDILESFAQADAAGYQGVEYDEYETTDDGHGRQQKRSYTVLYDLGRGRDKDEWPGLKVIGLCYSERTAQGETSSEARLFIGSKKQGAKFYGEGLRNHWGIESNCHWHLDVTFGEGDGRIRHRTVGLNMALLRRVALSLLKQHPGKGSIATKRYEATLDP